MAENEDALRWKSVIESAVDGIIVIDARGRIEAFNPAAERLFGYREAEMLGQNVRVLMPRPYRDEHDGYLANYARTNIQKIIGIGREVTGLRRDGTTFPLHLSVGEMMVSGERKFTGIVHDLSDRVRLEERMREQAALAHLGEMAAVVAHEVKNPLAGVRAALQIIAGKMTAAGLDAGVTGDIIARIDALNELMKDLLLFARPPQPRLSAVHVTSLVQSTVDLIAADPALHAVRVQVDGSSPPIEADPGLLKIVFLNLMVNGAQAMGGRGTVNVNVESSDSSCRIAFQDHGPGIPREVRDKLFTPFFTTKQRGTGLGLATAKRLIEAHHGSITIDCPHAGGTTVTVQLPVS